MVTVATLKLILDIALGLGVIYLCIRTAKAPHQTIQTEHLVELESSLTRLMKEANNASQELGVSLAKKQKQLEELLFDIETVEHRLNKGLDDAEEVRKSIRRLTTQRSGSEQSVAATRSERPAVRSERPAVRETQESAESREAQRPIIETPYQGASERAASKQTKSTAPQGLRAAIEKQIDARPIPPKRPVAPEQQIEVVSEQDAAPISSPQAPAIPKMQRGQVQRSLEDVYAHCEELIRAGKSIGEISKLTQMSESDVETLKGILMVESDIPQEEAGQQVVEQDSRLGVLGGKGRNPIGRTTQVL